MCPIVPIVLENARKIFFSKKWLIAFLFPAETIVSITNILVLKKSFVLR